VIEHLALTLGGVFSPDYPVGGVLTRVHSECLTDDPTHCATSRGVTIGVRRQVIAGGLTPRPGAGEMHITDNDATRLIAAEGRRHDGHRSMGVLA
jgi:hypothetical protein